MKIITDKWKGWKYRKAASAAAVVVLIGAGIMVYQGRTRAVECARAAIQDVEDYYTEDGVISFGEEYSIISEVNGPVKELLVKENDPVKQGDVLFEVGTSDYQYQLTAAENALGRSGGPAGAGTDRSDDDGFSPGIPRTDSSGDGDGPGKIPVGENRLRWKQCVI